MWAAWWAWAVAALVLAGLEILLPTQILLGFAIGAGVIALVLLVGGPIAAAFAASVPLTLLIFAVASLIAWLVLRRVVGVRSGQVKHWDTDINED